ncbi:Calcium-dependent protein kinase SK5 [Porphyridium purpureum]|uniref:Calcium-dependent protein kinase SK5 n=1 Tax=Porphyridium purpureum TaxID=35688 RepID=A0A5J4YYT1_PORPP|nr:Calcium-dependent protein kinase SK5 [Porphyridium purpureum]|eukprot:POR9172..scf208_2
MGKQVFDKSRLDGDNVFEKYEPSAKLGQGSFGTVLLVKQRSNPSVQLACKTLSKAKMTNETHLEDVRTEVEVMRRLQDNENVVRLFEVYEDQDSVHLVMELCSGGELFDRIIEKGHYSEADASELIRIMLKVVAACHAKGVVHRDLKPENFLLDGPDEHAKLKATDFGLSALATPGVLLKDQVGTPVYVAPEVLRGHYNHKSDMWSLGVILYILLCGRPPFYGRTANDELRMTLIGKYDMTKDPWPTISDSAKEVVRLLMRMDYNERPEAAELLTHPWVKKYGVASTQPLVASVRESMKKFATMSKLKKRALQFMASNLTEDEVKKMRHLFEKIDTDHSGNISVGEFETAMRATGNQFSDEDIVNMVKAYDVDESGEIDYSEFVTAMTNINKLRTADNMVKAFKKFDTDNDGTITVTEVMKALEDIPSVDEEYAKRMIAEADTNGDGKLDLEEFMAMMVENDEDLSHAVEKGRGRLNTADLQQYM